MTQGKPIPGTRRRGFTPQITPCAIHYTPLDQDGTCPACQKKKTTQGGTQDVREDHS